MPLSMVYAPRQAESYCECACPDESHLKSQYYDDNQKPSTSQSSNDIVEFAKTRPRLSALLVVCFVIGLMINAVYIPLPERWTNRNLMTAVELLLRLTYAYPIHLLAAFGPMHQTLYTRLIMDFYARVLSHDTLEDKDLKIYDTQIAGIAVRVYDPKIRRDNDGLIVFIHGGGFIVGEVAGYDKLVRHIATSARMTMISIEYHRAPEYRFPTQILEVEAVIASLLNHSHRIFRINPEKVMLMGDSAGGNLVAVMTQRFERARRNGSNLPPLRAQIMFYPLLQHLDLQTPSYQKYYNEYHGTGFVEPRAVARAFLVYIGADLNDELIDIMVNNRHSGYPVLEKHTDRISHNLLPKEYTSEVPYYTYTRDWHTGAADQAAYDHLFIAHNITNPDIMPLLGDLHQLPPAFIATCEFDVLRDEGYLYAHALERAGNTVEYKMYEGAFHAILNLEKLSLAQTMIDDAATFAQKHARSL